MATFLSKAVKTLGCGSAFEREHLLLLLWGGEVSVKTG
jgi:hypothetical protein